MRRLVASVALGFWFSLSAGAIGAQQQPQTLGPLDVFEFEYVRDVAVSPDGSRIIYVRQFSDIMSDRNCTNLWIVGTDGIGNRW